MQVLKKSISKTKYASHYHIRLFETVFIPIDIDRASSKFEPKRIESFFVKIKMARQFFFVKFYNTGCNETRSAVWG